MINNTLNPSPGSTPATRGVLSPTNPLGFTPSNPVNPFATPPAVAKPATPNYVGALGGLFKNVGSSISQGLSNAAQNGGIADPGTNAFLSAYSRGATPTQSTPASILPTIPGFLDAHTPLHTNLSGGAAPTSTSVTTSGDGSTTSKATYPIVSGTGATLPAANPSYVPGSIGPGNTPYTNSAPGTPGSSTNGGAITQNNATPTSQNGVQVGGPGYIAPGTTATTYTTPSGAVVDSNGNIISGPTNTASGILSTVLGAAGGNTAIGQNAANIAANYGKQIAQVGQQGANAQAGYLTTGTSPVAEGNAAVIAQNTAAQQNALSTGEEAALQGTGQQLTAQGQLQSGLATGLGAATQQVQAPYGTPLYNPATGQVTLGGQPIGTANGAFTPQQQISSLATALANGTGGIGYTTAYNQISQAFGPTVANTLLAAVQAQNPNFNIAQSDAQAAATGTNVETQGTSQTQIGQQGLSSATQNYTNASTYNTTAANQAKTLQGILSSTGINSGIPAYNQSINSLQNQLGSTNYSQFITGLNELQNAYSQLLSTGGGTPSQQDATALATLDPSKSASQINASIATLQQDAYDKLSSLYGNVQTYQNLLNSGGTTAGGGATTGGSITTPYGTINPNL